MHAMENLVEPTLQASPVCKKTFEGLAAFLL